MSPNEPGHEACAELLRTLTARTRHPKKDVEQALRFAEERGWTVSPTAGGHRWGEMICGHGGRNGCRYSIWSTPKNRGSHAQPTSPILATYRNWRALSPVRHSRRTECSVVLALTVRDPAVGALCRGTMVAMATEALRTVKDRLSEYVDRVQRHHERVVITRNGTPAAVLISADDLEALEETLDVLSDRAALAELREAKRAVANGDVVRGVDAVRTLRAR
ncbi:MAG TPA: type II toxin-antitoxin system Phd/YefM family antitoxin [Acidimicrobiales bacterium]|nr:type II toxin-antitoxin system Phd/YefM family antitoxin [Acidimicrobiales bacterium]